MRRRCRAPRAACRVRGLSRGTRHAAGGTLFTGVRRLLLLLAVLPAGVPAWGDMTLESYRARAREAAALARQASGAPDARAAELLRRARERFPARATVRDGNGASVTVENSEASRLLSRALAAKTPGERRAALAEFRQWTESLAAALDGAPARRDPQELAVVGALLEKPPFAPSAFERWEQELRERWRNWWQSRLARLIGDPSPATLEQIARGLYWVVLALLIALLAHLIWTYVPGLRLPGRAPGAGPDAGDAIVVPERARERLAAAEAAAAAGRYLEALRQTYAAMLLLLDEGHLLPYDPARTNREVLRSLRSAGHAAAREVLAPVTRMVDEKVYGGRPATAADYHGSRDACARLMGLLAP